MTIAIPTPQCTSHANRIGARSGPDPRDARVARTQCRRCGTRENLKQLQCVANGSRSGSVRYDEFSETGWYQSCFSGTRRQHPNVMTRIFRPIDDVDRTTNPDTMIALSLPFIAAIVGFALWWRSQGRRQHSRANPARVAHRRPGNFQCVEVLQQPDACKAVRRFAEKRFLSGEAPAIPVPGCDAAKCSCRYVHHKDRRHMDRRNPHAYQPKTQAGGERRIKRDRRRPAKT